MTIGTVKFFNTSKGFGFISPEGGGKDVFVHATAVEAAGMRTLNEGQKVSFDIQPDARGSKAANMKLGLKAIGRPAAGRRPFFMEVAIATPPTRKGASPQRQQSFRGLANSAPRWSSSRWPPNPPPTTPRRAS